MSPEWVEAELNASPLIAQSCVFAGPGSSLSALLFPATALSPDEIDVEIARINRDLPPYARVQRWHPMSRPFTTRNQMLTANGRLRRAQIGARLPQLLAASRTQAPAASGNSNRFFLEEIHP